MRKDIRVESIRGNVETRLKKLDAGEYDAIILARAGLLRLGLEERIQHVFTPTEMLPAVGQAALGIEIRTGDADLHTCLQQINHDPTHRAVVAERSLLSRLRGGCLAPIGAWAREVNPGELQLDAVVLNSSGSQRLFHSSKKPLAEPETLGVEAADHLLARGADTLIATARDEQ